MRTWRSGASAAIMAAALLGAVCVSLPSASALTMHTEEVTCPIDGVTFRTQVVYSSTTVGRMLDLRPVGATVSPMPRPVCPGNGFVMYKDKFTAEEIDKLRTIVASDAYKAARRENTDYFMIGFMFERMEPKPDPFAAGYIYLQALWETKNDADAQRQRYRALILEKLAIYLQTTEPSASDKWWSAHLISAEIERQSGLFDKASQRLAAMPWDKSPNPNYKRVADQIDEYAKMRDKNPQKMK